MNSSVRSVRQLTNIVIDCSILTLCSISICLSMGMFIFIIYHIIKKRNSPHRVALLLTANTYLSISIFCILLLEQYIRAVLGHIYLLTTLNDRISCQIRAYLLLVSINTIYYSNSLQSIYRLCRVVFYRKKSLQSFELYSVLIILKCIYCFLIIVPSLFRNYFKYLIDDYYCQLEFTNFESTSINDTLAYIIPMDITIGCYIYTLRKIRKGNTNLIEKMRSIQQMISKRDLIILLRICLLLCFLMTFFIPSTTILLIYQLTGYLPWWSSQIQWLVFISSVTCVNIVLPFISPHIRHLWTNKIFHHH